MTEDKPSQREDDSDDAATSISTGMNETLDSEFILFNRMPLLNYFRIGGSSIPVDDPGARMNHDRIQVQSCTCAAMTQVVVGSPGPEGVGGVSSGSDLYHLSNSDLWKQPYHVIAFGLSDGSIQFRSVYSGALLIHEERFKIAEVQSDDGSPVVDVAYDSTGTVLLGIDLDNNACMWDLKYSASFQQHEVQDPEISSQIPKSSSSMFPILSVNSVAVLRIKYPTSWASPTTIAIDPASRRSRERSFITGFRDGRLILTRRGGLFQRRTDTTLYHGTPDTFVDGTNYRGIECLAWRGSFVAWADANGIKLMDVQSLTRIAHIDRPNGARPAMYPSIPSLQPTLVFERSHSLLISWGDCLMSIEIEESKEPGVGSKRRNVDCSMAWELDCVSCGVAPLDPTHVIVLGLVPLEDGGACQGGATAGNDVEVQILSRADGTVIYCDSLPVQRQKMSSESEISCEAVDSVSFIKLMSSFATPMVEDSMLREVQNRFISPPMEASVLFGHSRREAARQGFQDAHLQWTLKPYEGEEEKITYYDEESGSVDSDDYGFFLRPEADSIGRQINDETAIGAPPVMVIVTPSDIIRTQTFTADDKITHAMTRNMSALALKHALCHKQELRRHRTVDLVDNFLSSVLRLRPDRDLDTVEKVSHRSLSLRRLQIALQSMPNLLGEQTARWGKWIDLLGAIPGVIFLLRDNLPVRDPVLPPLVYEGVLLKMLGEIGGLLQDNSEALKGSLLRYEEAANHFLDSLLAWGPTSGLHEFIRLYSSSRRERGTAKRRECQALEVALRRRFVQSCESYLTFPTTRKETESDASTSQTKRSMEGVSKSLFSIANISTRIVDLAPSLAVIGEFESEPQGETTDRLINSPLSFQAMARIRMMQQSYDEALRCYLMIGLYHANISFTDIEQIAVGTAKETDNGNSVSDHGFCSKYEFVLDLIEYHHLHWLLLDVEYLSEESLPLFALIQLVGLDHVGDFLISHCVSPEVHFGTSSDSAAKDMVQKETLPMDLVARHLERSPPLLFWYLNLVCSKKPDLYVRFPDNYIPPKAVTELHRKHLELHVKFAGGYRFSGHALSGVKKYEVTSFSTPLLSFLKASLPVGGLSAVEVRRMLDAQRSVEATVSDNSLNESKSSCFALELAFAIEYSSQQSETEAKGILDLYLDGVKSLNLAVSYAQRQKHYSGLLWDKLIGYCLEEPSDKRDLEGALFGELLEVSAVYGADLSRLVARIPAGMVVEGLRVRLVSAVADYRLKLGVHEAALVVSEKEKISLHRQASQRSKRGIRCEVVKSLYSGKVDSGAFHATECRSEGIETMKTKHRRDRYRLSYSLPMR